MSGPNAPGLSHNRTPSLTEAAILVGLQAILVAVLGGGSSNGFGVFHAPEHDLYPPLIAGAAVNLASFGFWVFWLLPELGRKREIGRFLRWSALVLLANIALQVSLQSLIIAVSDRAPKGVPTGELALENFYGAIFVFLFAVVYRAVADWVLHQAQRWRMSDHIAALEADVSQLRDNLDRLSKQVRHGAIELGAGMGARRFALDEIVYLKAAGNYTEVRTRSRTHTIYGTLKALFAQLPQEQFVRVHRSYVVNLQHVRAVRGGAVLLDDAQLPLGPRQQASAHRAWTVWCAG